MRVPGEDLVHWQHFRDQAPLAQVADETLDLELVDLAPVRARIPTPFLKAGRVAGFAPANIRHPLGHAALSPPRPAHQTCTASNAPRRVLGRPWGAGPPARARRPQPSVRMWRRSYR